MFGMALVTSWLTAPFPGALTALLVLVFACLIWMPFRHHHKSRKDESRHRLRRDYWGYE